MEWLLSYNNNDNGCFVLGGFEWTQLTNQALVQMIAPASLLATPQLVQVTVHNPKKTAEVCERGHSIVRE